MNQSPRSSVNPNADGSTLRILYIRQKNGAPIIEKIDDDILCALRQTNCTVAELDLSPLLTIQERGDTALLSTLQDKIIGSILGFTPHVAAGYNFTGIMPSGNGHVLEKLGIPYAGLLFDNPLYFDEQVERCKNKADYIQTGRISVRS